MPTLEDERTDQDTDSFNDIAKNYHRDADDGQENENVNKAAEKLNSQEENPEASWEDNTSSYGGKKKDRAWQKMEYK